MATAVALLFLAYSTVPALGQFSWATVKDQSKPSTGDGTFYGQQSNQDGQGACSYSANFANSNNLSWSSGADTTVALNDPQWDGGAGCGLCVRFRGTGAGLGTTPISTTEWQTGFVNNRCPECLYGSLDLNKNGNGRWKIEWYAVDCPVGDSTLRYDIVVSSQYWFSLVVSNTRIPVAGVEVKIGGTWVPLKRSANNQWPYYNTNGPWESSFPMPIRVTSAAGETIEDSVPSSKGGEGTKQFSATGGASSEAVPAGNSTASSSSPSTSPSPSPASTSPAASPSPSVSASPAAQQASSSSSSPAASGSSPAPSGAKMYIEDYGQCGGNALDCGKGSTTPCIAAAWPTAACKSSGWTCNRYDDGLYQCQPPKSNSGGSNSDYAAVSVGGRRLMAGL